MESPPGRGKKKTPSRTSCNDLGFEQNRRKPLRRSSGHSDSRMRRSSGSDIPRQSPEETAWFTEKYENDEEHRLLEPYVRSYKTATKEQIASYYQTVFLNEQTPQTNNCYDDFLASQLSQKVCVSHNKLPAESKGTKMVNQISPESRTITSKPPLPPVLKKSTSSDIVHQRNIVKGSEHFEGNLTQLPPRYPKTTSSNTKANAVSNSKSTKTETDEKIVSLQSPQNIKSSVRVLDERRCQCLNVQQLKSTPMPKDYTDGDSFSKNDLIPLPAPPSCLPSGDAGTDRRWISVDVARDVHTRSLDFLAAVCYDALPTQLSDPVLHYTLSKTFRKPGYQNRGQLPLARLPISKPRSRASVSMALRSNSKKDWHLHNCFKRCNCLEKRKDVNVAETSKGAGNILCKPIVKTKQCDVTTQSDSGKTQEKKVVDVYKQRQKSDVGTSTLQIMAMSISTQTETEEPEDNNCLEIYPLFPYCHHRRSIKKAPKLKPYPGSLVFLPSEGDFESISKNRLLDISLGPPVFSDYFLRALDRRNPVLENEKTSSSVTGCIVKVFISVLLIPVKVMGMLVQGFWEATRESPLANKYRRLLLIDNLKY